MAMGDSYWKSFFIGQGAYNMGIHRKCQYQLEG